MRLAGALEESATSALRRVADAHGVAHDDSTTRDELISRIAERFGDSAYVAESLGSLSDDEREVLSAARVSGGEPRGLLVDRDHPGIAESLADRGWLYRVFAAAGPLRGEVFVVPDELLAALPPPPPSGAEAVAPAAEEPAPSERRSTDPAFSVFALVSALTRPGGHLEDEVRPWSEEPGGWDWNARWNFLQHLAIGSGLLVHRVDGKLAPGPMLGRLLDDPPSLFERLWRSYVGDVGWSELAQAEVEDGADLADTVGLRRSIVERIEQLPEGRWISFDALSDWLQRTRPTLVREQLNPRGLVRLQALGWGELEKPLLRSFALGPLYWLGVLAADRNGAAIARRARGQSIVHEPCGWDGTAELVAPARAQLGTVLQAERYLVLRGRGRMSRYHLVQSHVASALAAGGSIAECQTLLTKLTQAPLPPALQERLSAWDRRFGALDIRPAVVVEGRSESELDEALAVEHVRPFVRSRLGPRVAEVAAADALELANALRDSGHLPRIDAALRLAAEPRRAYAGLVDEQVLEFLLVSLLAFQVTWPERLAELEGSAALLERLERQFPPERLAQLRSSADRLAGALAAAPAPSRRSRGSRRSPSSRGSRRGTR